MDKAEQWGAQLALLDHTVDALGEGIDEGVVETVAALNLLGINTIASCEGHLNEDGHGLPYPWVDVAGPNEPSERFLGQAEAYEKTALKHGISTHDVQNPRFAEAFNEARATFRREEEDETPEWKAWWIKDAGVQEQARTLIDEFNETRTVTEDERVRITDYRIHNGGPEDLIMKSDLPLTDLQTCFSRRRMEWEHFTEFLKRKFFNDSR